MLYKCRCNYLNKLRYYSILKVFFNSTEFYFLARQHGWRFYLKCCTFHKTSFSQARAVQHIWRFIIICCTNAEIPNIFGKTEILEVKEVVEGTMRFKKEALKYAIVYEGFVSFSIFRLGVSFFNVTMKMSKNSEIIE